VNARQHLARLFGFPDVQGGNAPGWPDSYLFRPYQLDRLAFDYPKAVRRVVTVHACVMRIAEDLAQLPIVFEREKGADWEPVKRTAGNIVDVWAKANDEQTSYELVRDLHAHLKGSGNAYLVAETFGTKRVHELYLAHPQLTQVIPGKRRSEAAYLFNRGGRLETIDAKWMVHFRNYNPDFEPYGASDLECVEEQYSTRYDIGRLMGLFTRGGGVPAGYFSVIGPDGQASGGVLPEPDQKRLQSQIMRLFNGIKNAFRPKILSAVKWDRMGLTPKEMNLIEQANLSDMDICRALGVPPWMVGIKDSTGLGGAAGAAAADRSIYIRNTIMPQVALRDAVLTERLVPMFGEVGVRARTDLSSVQELFLPLVNSAQQVVSLAGGVAVFSVNELRKMYGQPAREEPEADELAEKVDPLGAFGAPPKGEEPTPAAEPKTAPVKKDEARVRMIDGDEVRETRRKKASANLSRYERKVARLYGDILNTQQSRIISRLEAQSNTQLLNGQSSKRALDVDEITAPDPDDEKALARLLAQLVRDRGEEALADLALELQLDLNSARAAAFVTRQAQRSLALTEATTREAVRKQISEGLAANESLGQIVERIRVMPEFGQARAVTIARTETVSAYNFATKDAWEQSGVVEQTEWLSSRDTAVRESHAEADGQRVSIGQAYSVGGASLAFPGDPGGPPEEVIQCRCTEIPVVNEKARARRQFEKTLARLLGGKVTA